jgi:hypothetical protein
MRWFSVNFGMRGTMHGAPLILLRHAPLGQSTLMRISLGWPRLLPKKAKGDRRCE